MKKEILYAGLDVDDQAYHFFGLTKTTGEVIEFKCFSSVNSLEKKLDAEKLARYYSNDLLTVVHVPTVENEADRDLLRTRKFLVEQQISTKNHINSFCRRLNLDFRKEIKGKNIWTKAYMIRLHKKGHHLLFKGKNTNKMKVACARDM